MAVASILTAMLAIETIHISGKVVDAETRQPVADAVVIFEPVTTTDIDGGAQQKEESTAVTDRDGRFDVDETARTYTIAVQREGYEPFARTETLTRSTDWDAALEPDHACEPRDPDVHDRLTVAKGEAGSDWVKAFRRLFASSPAGKANRIGVEFFSDRAIEQAVRVQRGRKGEASVVALELEESFYRLVQRFVWDHEDSGEPAGVVRAKAWASVLPRLRVVSAPISELTSTRLEQLWASALRTAADSHPACAPFEMHDIVDFYVLGDRAALVRGAVESEGSRMRALRAVVEQLSDLAGAPVRERATLEGRLLDVIEALLARFDSAEEKLERNRGTKARPH
jgi:hypothetical protein